jgi:predicted metal-dependent phosphoesterase TrpH
MPGDLHTHSTFSDGSVPIARIPAMAARAGLDTLAVSDHDTLRSVRYAQEHPEQDGVSLIPATELSAWDGQRGRRVHLLAYWPQICPAIEGHCARMAQRRNADCLRSAQELAAIYPQFTPDQALAYAQDSGVLFKSCIMQALMQLGLADGIYGDEYRRLFGKDPRGIILHETGYDSLDTVLDTLKSSRAVVVFAHPSVYHSMELVRELAAAGRIDGIEADHPRNRPEDREECLALCARYGLVATGGTDFHGANSRHPKPVGTCRTSAEAVARLRELARSRQSA